MVKKIWKLQKSAFPRGMPLWLISPGSSGKMVCTLKKCLWNALISIKDSIPPPKCLPQTSSAACRT